MDKVTIKLFTTCCFIEFMADGKLRSASGLLPLVLAMSSTLAQTSNIAITTPGTALVLLRHEDLVGKIRKLAGVGKRKFLVPMKEFTDSLVILEVVKGIEACHELSNDVLPIMSELILSVWVCP